MRLSELLRVWLRVLTGRSRRPPVAAEETDASALFSARYHALRLLLAANNKALDLMADMERAVAGDTVFGTAFVQSRCTALGVSVYQMVRHLDVLTDGGHPELLDRLEAIQGQLRAVLEVRPPKAAPLVLPLAVVDRRAVDVVGAKMANLGEIRNAVGLPVPPGFVITASAYDLLLRHNDLQPEIDRLIQSTAQERTDELFALSSRIRQLIVEAEAPAALVGAVDAAYEDLSARLGFEPAVALRSSALGEDSAGASYAGQYRSVLNVRRDHLLDAYREVVASKYSPQAMDYRLRLGLRDEQLAMCVGCFVMVDSGAGGVAYTANPRDPDDLNIHISATPGLPVAVVDGRVAVDQYVVGRGEPRAIVDRRIARKETVFVCDPVEGVGRRGLAEDERLTPSLSDREAVEVASLALRLERHFGSPQDVEWAVGRDGEVVFLQSRPLQQVASPATAMAIGGTDQPLLAGGVCASPGAAGGVVHWVRRDGDALSFADGEVLVLQQPLPRWAALVGRAAAVVSEQGSLAGHLATVARELGVPALFGVADAGALRDGAEVTVLADAAQVIPGRDDAVLAPRTAVRPVMLGTPVHGVLTAALQHITPLNLLDPDGLEFRAVNCRTLHDITRFCHEQSVREMFDFGRTHRFPRHASKRLFHNVPMQWWVLNLDDGFVGDVDGKYVRLEEIACAPMHALWDGMTAVVWDGPPAVDGRGLASVLFHATTNPALATPFRKPYAQRNYFMISRDFVNLQSRFGFHFSTVEALASDRPPENYISFTFKGGAADDRRKAARARFVADLLEEQGFAVSVKEDLATARVGGLGRDDSQGRIRVIGYLIMHTRQLDMVMDHRATVEHYRGKMRGDIETLL